MPKTILITGATDGIGHRTATLLAAEGHNVLLHGRDPAKLEDLRRALSTKTHVRTFCADLSSLSDTLHLANELANNTADIDVVINNAGVFKTAAPRSDGLDVRFTVNTLAPYLLARRLAPLLGPSGRIVNVSSAAQSPVDLAALRGETELADDFDAYAQSKLAITMWTRALAAEYAGNGPLVIAVNPGSLLGTKMVKDAFGREGSDIGIGADILIRVSLSDDFASATGLYFDNDIGQLAPPHPDALDAGKCQAVVAAIDAVIAAH